uniref:Uncharacterized protein n=1 Tax=Magallana gigas TaxID=29159 RepID=K1QDB1_MAGGI
MGEEYSQGIADIAQISAVCGESSFSMYVKPEVPITAKASKITGLTFDGSYKEGLAEVCAPRDQITGFCCALYDEGVGRVVEDYTRPCSNCSFRYPSDNIVKYPQCIAPPKTTFSDNDTKESAPCLNGKKRGKRHAECRGVLNENAGHKQNPDVLSCVR